MNTIYETKFLLTLSNGKFLIAQLQKVGRRYFWINTDYEIGINIEDPQIINATPMA